jgi:hypothetical protein
MLLSLTAPAILPIRERFYDIQVMAASCSFIESYARFLLAQIAGWP